MEEASANQNPQMDTDEDVQKGKLSLAKKDYATAVEHFSAAVERFVHHYGQLASECGEVYYYYGLALFREVEQQEENQDVFGSAVPREIPTGRSEDAGTEPSCAVPSSTGDSETLKDGDSSEVQAQQQETKDEDSKEEDGGNEEGDEDEDAPAPEEQGDSNVENVEDPLQLAWEVLDTARTIFEKDDDQNIRLADVLLLLGDVCLRNEMFDNAVQDYEKCLSIRTQILKPDDRLIMEVHHQIAIAKLNYTDSKVAEQHRDAAVQSLRKAIQVCELRLENLNKILSADCEVGQLETSVIPTSRGALEEEINEFEAIKEELEQRIESEETVGEAPAGQNSGSNQAMALGGDSLQAVLAQAGLGGAQGTQIGFGTPPVTEAVKVKSLGVFGKGKSKAAAAAAAAESACGKREAESSLDRNEEKKARLDAVPERAEVISAAATPATQTSPKVDGDVAIQMQ